MSAEKAPLSPVYMTYMYNQPHPGAASIGTSSVKPYRPATQMSQTEHDLAGAKGVDQHFQSPCNDHNRFLAVVPECERAAYRDIRRMLPPPFDQEGEG